MSLSLYISLHFNIIYTHAHKPANKWASIADHHR